MIVTNTVSGWEAFAAQLEKIPDLQKAPPLEAEVYLRGPLDSIQFSSLQYALLEFDRMETKAGGLIEKKLSIHVHSENDAYRILDYFWLIARTREKLDLSVHCSGREIRQPQSKNTWNVSLGRIFPLLCIGSSLENASVIDARLLLSPADPAAVHKGLLRLFEDGRAPDVTEPSPGGIPPVSDLMEHYILSQLQKCFQELSGTAGRALLPKEKEACRRHLQSILLADLPRLGLLVRMLWSISLWTLALSKDLLCQNKEGEWEVDMEAVHCSRLDAISYGEGLQQLIENACLHSDMRRAYLHVRIYDVDITGSGPKTLSDAAQTRIGLERRVAVLSTDEKKSPESAGKYHLKANAKHYFELQVLNDSVSLTGGGPKGIAEMYFRNLDLPWPCKTGYTLKKIFEEKLTPPHMKNDPAHLAQHYGLRVFEKGVQLNDGYFYVSSPGLSDEEKPVLDRYQSFASGQSVPELNSASPRRYTSYFILLPILPHWHSTDGTEPPEELQSLFDSAMLTGDYRQLVLRFHSDGNQSRLWFSAQSALQDPGPTPPKPPPQFPLFTTPKQKMAEVESLHNALNGRLQKADEHTVCLLDLMQARHYGQIELLAKMLFLFIARQSQNSGAKSPRLFALLLPAKEHIWEFIRIFSIFYDKLADGNNMPAAQIALCAYPEAPAGQTTPEVAFLLAGGTSASARITARIFAYYNAGSTLEMIPQLRYLTRGTEKSAATPQFPFDLFLTAQSASAPLAAKGKSWFLRQMDDYLQRDLWERPLGCRIRDIKLRLGSNILITDFYEAELLFHNIGIIYRFAYLIARDLLRQLQGSSLRPLALVGYENYSTVLVQHLAALLEDRAPSVHYLIYSGQAGTRQNLHFSPALHAMEERARRDFLSQADYLAVVPISSTLSTLCRIQSAVEGAGARKDAFSLEHYSLILVGCRRQGEGPSPSDAYWTRQKIIPAPSPFLVTLTPAKAAQPGGKVRCFLSPSTRWIVKEDSSDDPLQEDVLVYLDQTSTIPRDIFVGEHTRFRGVSAFIEGKQAGDENQRRAELLKSCTLYGHLYTNSNHFQFYFDMDRYYAKISAPAGKSTSLRAQRKSLDLWLKGLREKPGSSIDPNAYNIIVSPLHQEDSPFVKAVADQVFEHSLRFLHVDFSNTFREDIRAKFSYVAEEYARIKRFDRDKPVNVYFVNTAITSGATLQRARNLMIMLLEEAGVSYDRSSVFKGCFVLVNRSGFDTLNSYVDRPLENFHAYVHLAVPSLNLRRDRCPTCELVELYRTIEQRCSSGELRKEFRRLAEKHEKRSVSQYLDWLREMTLTRSGYAGWLMQWLHCYVPLTPPNARAASFHVGIFDVDREMYLRLQNLRALLDWGLECFLSRQGLGVSPVPDEEEAYLKALGSFSLKELRTLIDEDKSGACASMPHSDRAEDALDPRLWTLVMLDYVCGQKNHLRIIAIHTAFLEMDRLTDQLYGMSPRERGRLTETRLSRIICRQLSGTADTALKVEWLISYLKVMSRPHLSQYHHIRQGILNLLLQAAFVLLQGGEGLPIPAEASGETGASTGTASHPGGGEDDGPEAGDLWRYLRREAPLLSPLMRYQLLKTILKRLAGLQSAYLLQPNAMLKILEHIDALRSAYFAPCRRQAARGAVSRDTLAAMRFQPFPPEEDIRIAMVKLVKWAASCGDDEGGCYLIEEAFQKEGTE